MSCIVHLNSESERNELFSSTQAPPSPAASPIMLATAKETSTCMYRNFFMLNLVGGLLTLAQ